MVSFTLHDVAGDDFALVEWADPPELQGEVILQHNPCYVLLASHDFAELSSKNCVYFFSWQHLEEEKHQAEFCLCKWDLLERVSTIVKKMPSDWDWAMGRWFLPSLK